jgi:hypothetical protein
MVLETEARRALAATLWEPVFEDERVSALAEPAMRDAWEQARHEAEEQAARAPARRQVGLVDDRQVDFQLVQHGSVLAAKTVIGRVGITVVARDEAPVAIASRRGH